MPDGLTNPNTLAPDVLAAIEEGARKSATAAALKELTATIEDLRVIVVATADAVEPSVMAMAKWNASRAGLVDSFRATVEKPIGVPPATVEVRTLVVLAVLGFFILLGLGWFGIDPITASSEFRRIRNGECVETTFAPAPEQSTELEAP